MSPESGEACLPTDGSVVTVGGHVRAARVASDSGETGEVPGGRDERANNACAIRRVVFELRLERE